MLLALSSSTVACLLGRTWPWRARSILHVGCGQAPQCMTVASLSRKLVALWHHQNPKCVFHCCSSDKKSTEKDAQPKKHGSLLSYLIAHIFSYLKFLSCNYLIVVVCLLGPICIFMYVLWRSEFREEVWV